MANKIPQNSSTPKTITVYRSGDTHLSGVKITFNKRQVPTFETLLDILTSKIKAPFGVVRKLYTVDGTKVCGLDELQHGEAYVAAGNQPFKKLDYCEKPKNSQPQKKKEEKVKPTEDPTAHKKKKTVAFADRVTLVPPVQAPCKNNRTQRKEQLPAVATERRAQEAIKPVVQINAEQKLRPFSIKVFTNGEPLIPSMNIKIPKYALKSMEGVLAIVADIMSLHTGVKSLYTLDGQPVTSPAELKFDGHYVAVNKGKFKPCQYFCKNNGRKVIKPVVQTKTVTTGKKEKQHQMEFFIIDVFTNGEALIPSVAVKIPKTALKSMDSVCSVVGSMMCSHAGVKRLYTLDGHLVKDPKELKNDGQYVAVSSGRFKPAKYFQPVPVPPKEKRKNKCKETPPAVQTACRKEDVHDKISEDKCDIWIRPPSSPKSSPHQSDVEMSSPAHTPSSQVSSRHQSDVEMSSPARTPSSQGSSRHQPQVEMSSPASSNKDVAESGCQEEAGIQESEQISKNKILKSEQPKKEEIICPPTRLEKVFIEMVQRCSEVHDFDADPEYCFVNIHMKQMMLKKLADYITDERTIISECIYPEIVNMCAAHMFRALHPLSNPPAPEFNSQSEEPKLDPAWPQIQAIHEFFQTFLRAPSFQVAIAKKYIDNEFVVQLLQQFVSEDPRERQCLQLTVCCVYHRLLELRSCIITGIADMFCRFVHEKGQPTGISDLLELIECIFKRIEPPFTEDSKILFFRVIVPLHKLKTVRFYHQELVRCMVQFLTKDATLTGPLVLYLLKCWPKTSTCKELLFIEELQEILQYIYASEFKLVQKPLFKQLARCISGSNILVAKAVLEFCTKEHITCLISENAAEILPIVLPALYQCSNSQLYEPLKYILTKLLPQLLKMNPELFTRCTEQIMAAREKEQVRLKESEKMWMKIEMLAKSKAQ